MANVGDVKKVKGENGNYMVKTLENGYSITKEGETASMDLITTKKLTHGMWLQTVKVLN